MADPASILAFVLAGLKSAKIAYDILSSFKDAPERVRRATEDVKRLRSTLERLSKCRVLEGPGGRFILEHMDDCLKDLNAFSRELTHLTVEPQSSRRKRSWKRLMAMWEEKSLSDMSDALAHHTASFTFALNTVLR